MSASMAQGAPVMMTQSQAAQSFAMPDMFSSPGLTHIMQPQQVYAAPQVATMGGGSVTYAAAPQVTTMGGGSVTYMQGPSATMMPQQTYAAPSMTYAAAEPVGTMTYGAPQMTYAAPQAYAAPMAGQQPLYTISPERFQMIMAGQPLTNEEIAAMTGAPTAAPVATQSMTYAAPVATMGGASFAMPDMFASPGITNVFPGAAPVEASQVAPAASTVVAAVTTEAPATEPKKSSKKSSSKKSSKKKLSSKKKAKGCC